MGAALLVMVCDLTLGRPKYSTVQAEVQSIRDQSERIRTEARRLVDEDAQSFKRVAGAMKLPRETEHERSERRAQLQAALKGATQPPLATMILAAHGAELAARLAPIGNKSAISDVGSGALAFDAGFTAAYLNVEINLASIGDEEFVRTTRESIPSVESTRKERELTVDRVLFSIRGDR